MPCVTVNSFGKGKAYYAAFRNDVDFANDLCDDIIRDLNIHSDVSFEVPSGTDVRKRGNLTFILNFSDEEKSISLDREYTDIVNGCAVKGNVSLPAKKFLIITE